MRFGHLMRMKESTLKRFFRLDKFDQHLALHRADCLGSHRNLEGYEFVQAKLRELPPQQITPALLATGDDLIRAGYKPGPRFREILEAVEDAQLEGQISSPAAAMDFVREHFPPE